MRYDQDRIDGTMLEVLSEHHMGAGPFRFTVPSECLDSGSRGGSTGTPGIYLRAWGRSSGGPHPYARAKLLAPLEAQHIAEFLDQFHPLSFCCHGRGMENWPHTYAEIVECFYGALGRRLDKAIDASTSRAAGLREVRAAITGRVIEE